MVLSDIAFIQLFWDLMNRRTGAIGRVEYEPQKPLFDAAIPDTQPLPRSTPEEQGVRSDHIAAFLNEVLDDPKTCLHQFMIVRHGQVLCECAVQPYEKGVWHATYSMCKSFTGMAIGLLIDDGKISLDDRVLEILKRYGSDGSSVSRNVSYISSALKRPRLSDLTIRHLLTMSSGCSLNEVGAISGNDWVKAFFDASCKFEPGEKFEYNSMNSFILSAVVSKVTGKSMFEFLNERLFAPMGIIQVFWEHSPTGITKGGWGMFLRPEDAAKLGLLYLNGGMWNGKRLISEKWCREATSPQIQTGKKENPLYGYHCWIGPIPGSFVFNGMLGQNVYVYPSTDLIVVINAGNQAVFGEGKLTKLVRKYFCDGYCPSEHPIAFDSVGDSLLKGALCRCEGRPLEEKDEKEEEKATENGQEAGCIARGGWKNRRRQEKHVRSSTPHSLKRAASQRFSHTPVQEVPKTLESGPCSKKKEELSRFFGETFEMESGGVGLFPVVLQVLHNNYTNGITYLTFEEMEGGLVLNFLEGDMDMRIPVLFEGTGRGLLDFCAEPYQIGTRVRLAFDEDGQLVLCVLIFFTEEACVRNLKITFISREEILLSWGESPGDRIVQGVLSTLTIDSGNTGVMFNGVMRQISPELISGVTGNVMEPNVRAHISKRPGKEEVKENANASFSQNSTAQDEEKVTPDDSSETQAQEHRFRNRIFRRGKNKAEKEDEGTD